MPLGEQPMARCRFEIGEAAETLLPDNFNSDHPLQIMFSDEIREHPKL